MKNIKEIYNQKMRKMFTENMKSIFTEDMLKKYDENMLNVLKEVGVDILNVNYEEANKKRVNINKQEIYEIIWNMADITESFTFYGFSQYMYKKTENVIWLNLSTSLLSFTFCCVEGAYAVGIFHAREAVGIEKNLENLVTLLSFYGLPEYLMDDEEAENIAKEILELDKNNERAIYVLNEILNSKKE
ncbi:hypothetical protein HMPREF3180_01667 [Leptotrichia wadei]|uniref:Uncharacterized protein n=1 Tax=Leptotrichia wadei TaxID=157687 RepID=A0A134A3D5_9FUSO|nr:hypothetical protein [Leptotrichia wadei]KXB62215.1 hypothetical protein HMPREF3180_01667 [Leptotrichia wadei]